MLFPAAALVIGVASGRAFLFFPYTVTALSLAALTALILFRHIGPGHKVAASAFYALGVLVFFLYGPGASSPVGGLIDKGPVLFTGEVVRPPDERDDYTIVDLAPRDPRTGPGRFLPARPGLVRLGVKGTGLGMAYGDVISGELTLRPPRGFQNPGTFNWGEYARLNGVDAVSSVSAGSLRRPGYPASRGHPFLKRLYSLRQRLIALSRTSLPGPSSAIFRAMVLGDQGGVTDGMRDEFAASGATHILSVSGSHVALLAALIFFMARWSFFLLPHPLALRLSLRVDSRKAAAAAAIPVAALYCMLAGSEVATVRSVIMITVYLFSIILDREGDFINTLSAAAIIAVLWDPCAVFDISFQLSYSAVLFMALAISEFRAVKQRDATSGYIDRFYGKAAYIIVPSLAVIIGTAPLVARQFNAFSYVALPANLIVLPVAGFAAVPVGLVSCLIHALSPGETLPLTWLNDMVFGAFYAVVRFFASVPSANIHPAAPSLFLIALFYAFIAATLVWRAGLLKKGACVLAAAAALYMFNAVRIPGGQAMKVTFLDVGQGDSALVRFPDGRNMLVDGGGSLKGIDPGRATVAPYLWNHGIRRLDWVVLTHPHPDHMKGLYYILENFDVGQVWEGGLVSDTDEYRLFRSLVSDRGIPRLVLDQRGETRIGGAVVQVLHTASEAVEDTDKARHDRENNRSLVLRVKYGEVSFLLTGDVEREAEETMLRADPPLPLRSAVLKVPHHGSFDVLSMSFLEGVRPKAAVISVARYNPYRHPSPDTVAALASSGAEVLRTDTSGAVSCITDGRDLDAATYESLVPARASCWEDELENLKRITRGQK